MELLLNSLPCGITTEPAGPEDSNLDILCGVRTTCIEKLILRTVRRRGVFSINGVGLWCKYMGEVQRVCKLRRLAEKVELKDGVN